MKFIKKEYVAAVLALVICMGCSACGAKGDSEESSKKPEESQKIETTAKVEGENTPEADNDEGEGEVIVQKEQSKVLFPEEYTYVYDEAGRIVKGEKAYNDYLEYEYDESGAVSKLTKFLAGAVEFYVVPTLDESGKPLELDYYSKNDVLIRIYKYNDSELCVESVEYSGGEVKATCKYEYDAEGREVKSFTYNANGVSTGRNETEYNSDGIVVKYIEYHGNGLLKKEAYFSDNGTHERIVSYYDTGIVEFEEEYDSDGALVNNTIYFEDGEIQYELVTEVDGSKSFHYDEDGNVLSGTEIDIDSHGRQVKKTCYKEGGVVDYYVEYEHRESGRVERKYSAYGVLERYIVVEETEEYATSYLYYTSDSVLVKKSVTMYDEFGTAAKEMYYDSMGNLTGWEDLGSGMYFNIYGIEVYSYELAFFGDYYNWFF